MTNPLDSDLAESADFEHLMQCLLDATCSDDDVAKLADLLEQNPQYRREYIERINLHAALAWHAVGDVGSAATVADQKLLECLAEAMPQPGDLTVDAAIFCDDRMSLAQFNCGIERNRSISRRRRWLATCAAALVFYGLFVLLSWNLRPNEPVAGDCTYGSDSTAEKATEREASLREPEAIARLGQTLGVQWNSEQSKREVAKLTVNQVMQISSGIAEVLLASGVRLVVEGPAELQLLGENAAKLTQGCLVAQVSAGAIGFTVQTPSATIVDLSTEFGVEVADASTTNITVLAGAVRIDSGGKNRLAQSQILTTGQSRSVTVDASGTALVEPTGDVLQVRSKKVLSSLDRPIGGVGVLASSEFTELNRTANHLVNGAGLTSDGHTNSPDGTMWHSLLGRVENEYVLFDLLRVHRLAKCKVWNYNEASQQLFLTRGVAIADIFISATGRGNPVTDPAEWQLVVRDEHIPAADGTDQYATAHEISFDDVQTRFVALVIRSAHGRDPRYPQDLTKQCAGLAEVQFFGQRVNGP